MADNLAPRLLTREEAARYCGATIRQFSNWIRRGVVPQKMPGTNRWDLKAIDAALDRNSKLTTNAEPEDAYLKWKREQGRK